MQISSVSHSLFPSSLLLRSRRSNAASNVNTASNSTVRISTPLEPSSSSQPSTKINTPDNPGDSKASPSANKSQDLSDAEKRQVSALKNRDRAVRAHEAAHLSAAGGLARGGANFSYLLGPDGQQYAVGGEVSIDTSAVPNDPQATILKAQTIRAAALAPAQPSGADRAIAAHASQMEAEARVALLNQNTDERQIGAKEISPENADKAPTERLNVKSAIPNSLSQHTNEQQDPRLNSYQQTLNSNSPFTQLGQLLNATA